MKVILLILSVSALLFGAYTRDGATNTVYDSAADLTWQDSAEVSVGTNRKAWSDAINYCEALDFAGVQDWRLPNFNELYMITDDSTYNPAMQMSATNGFVHVTSGYYWSSTTRAADSSDAWNVYFNNGDDYWGNKTNSDYVRCVRDGQIAPLTLPFLPAIVYYLLQ